MYTRETKFWRRLTVMVHGLHFEFGLCIPRASYEYRAFRSFPDGSTGFSGVLGLAPVHFPASLFALLRLR